jgi:hypothetical protein
MYRLAGTAIAVVSAPDVVRNVFTRQFFPAPQSPATWPTESATTNASALIMRPPESR